MGKAIEQRRHRIGGTLSIHHQHHRNIQHAGYLGRRAPVAVVAVKESHHAFDNADISIVAIVPEEFTHMLWRRHEGVEIDRRSPAHRLVELRVNVIRSALEGLHTIAFLPEQRHQPPGNGRLARAAGRCCYEKCALHVCKGSQK